MKFSEKTMQVLYGSLLGDGSLQKNTLNSNAFFQEGHSIKQEEYLIWKANNLEKLKPKIFKKYPKHQK